MSSPYFQFKQFTVWHDRCGHRVGTDGVLLGAWAKIAGRRHILDIGTGSGLIALMVAQREPLAHVVGVEVDEGAAAQARENVFRSPFSQKIDIEHCDVRNFQSIESFDSILCNPPYFPEDTLPDDASRALARHSSLLRFDELLTAILRLMSRCGELHVILPYSIMNAFENQTFIRGLYTKRRCLVHTLIHKPPKRVLLSLSRQGPVTTETETLVLQDGCGKRSVAYQELTKDFYLDIP